MENKEPKTEFNVGDVVRLKSDFTNMVIESMPDENHAYCV
jgi:uncharacterized protein YodC (DUF2158 family)